MKEYFRKKSPRLFVYLRDIKDQFIIELRTLKTIGVLNLIKSVVKNNNWRKELPVQKPRRFDLVKHNFNSIENLILDLTEYCEGNHSIYLSPLIWKTTFLNKIQNEYPQGSGIKIMKKSGGVGSSYIKESKRSLIQEKSLGSHLDQILVINYLKRQNIAPKLYDVIEIKLSENHLYVAYIMEHIQEINDNNEQCNELIGKIKKLIDNKSIALVNWNGFNDNDFVCPDCNGNLLKKSTSKVFYVDSQNFKLLNYDKEIYEIINRAEKNTHYGDKSLILGGKYLYQAIPGVNIPAKRKPEERMSMILKLLKKSKINLENNLFIDIGCNLGLMGAQYLKNGAYWYHGIDFDSVIDSSEEIMSAIGCTRYSFSRCKINMQTDINKQLPGFLSPHINKSIISYLSIRKHIGWLESLKTIHWKYMFYEGHEDEDKNKNLSYIEELNKFNSIEIINDTLIQDGASRQRYFAVIKNTQ